MKIGFLEPAYSAITLDFGAPLLTTLEFREPVM